MSTTNQLGEKIIITNQTSTDDLIRYKLNQWINNAPNKKQKRYRVKCLASLQLLAENWTLEEIGIALDGHKGQVSRWIKFAKKSIPNYFYQ